MEISEAYGKYYDEFKKWIDKDGWFDGINLPTGAMGLIDQMTNEIPCDFNRDNFKHRPKSLNIKHTQKYQGKTLVTVEIYSQYKDKVELKFLIDTLKSLPIDKLKQLLNFKSVDPYRDIPKDYHEAQYFEYLKSQYCFELRSEITI